MIVIENQPISFKGYSEMDSACNLGDRKQYCQLFQNGDTIKAQWILEACSTDECDSVSDNLLLNSTFTGNADNWTAANGAAYNSNAVDFSPNGSGSQLSQTVALDATKCHLLVFTISNYVAGTVTPVVGGVSGTTAAANGTFYRVIDPSGNNVSINGNALADLSIDDVYVYELGCYCPDTDDISLNPDTGENDGALCHVPGTATTITIGGASLFTGRYYGITILISGQANGSCRIVAGTNAGEWFDSNGEKTSYLTANGQTITIEMDSDFDGCLSFVSSSLYPALSDWEVSLFDLDDNWVREIQTYGGTNFITYVNNTATLAWYVPDSLYYSPELAEGCYKICLIDPCLEHAGCVYGLNIFEDNFNNGSQWTLDSNIEINGGFLIFITDGLGGDQIAEATAYSCSLFDNCTLTVRINFYSLDNAYLDTDIIVNIGDVIETVTLNAQVFSDMYVDFEATVTSCDGFSIEFDNSVDPGGGVPEIAIDSLFVKVKQECFFNIVTPDYCSQCINIKESHPCTLLFDAYCNEPALGFDFTHFSLTTRLRTLFINPISKVKNENYKLSDGSYYKVFAERDKVWSVWFDYVDEITHDTIAAMLLCDHMTIYEPTNFPNTEEYLWTEDSYKPEWDKDGYQKLAQSRIELRKKQGHLTNSNCS